MTRLTLPAALILALALTLTAFSGAAFAQDSSIDVELGEFYIDMPTTIPAGPVTLNVSSVGSMPHTLTITGDDGSLTMPETLSSGGSTTWEIDLEPGTYTFWCPIGNHRDQGMELTVTVEAAQAEPTPVPVEPTATTPPAADPTASPAAADPTPTVDDDYTDPSTTPNTPTPEADATPTALPGLPETGSGGSQSDGASSATIAALAALVLLLTATGGGLLYRRQRQTL